MSKVSTEKELIRKAMSALGSRTSKKKKAACAENFKKANQVRWENYRLAHERQ